MSNELQVNGQFEIQNPGTATFHQSGSGTQIGYVANQTINLNINGYSLPQMPAFINREYFNLFVVEAGPLDGKILMAKRDSLNEYTSELERKVFAKPNLEAAEKIKEIPALIMVKNTRGNVAEDNQYAAFGFVTELKDFGEYIQVSYVIFNQIKQQRLNELADSLKLKMAPDVNELDVVHWSIKKVNLMDVLGL